MAVLVAVDCLQHIRGRSKSTEITSILLWLSSLLSRDEEEDSNHLTSAARRRLRIEERKMKTMRCQYQSRVVVVIIFIDVVR